MQRLRIRFAKRGRLRFTSHRDFQRAFERALRRAGIPMAYSAGFSPHPKISYVGAAPTGTASEAEYLEIALTQRLDAESVRTALDDALPAGLDVLEVIEARGGTLADRIEASIWELRLPGMPAAGATAGMERFMAAPEVPVERLLKDGRRRLDARSGVLRAEVSGDDDCAILKLVVRHLAPAVRPDDVLSGLRQVADLAPPVPPVVTRLAQGLLDEGPPPGRLADPLAPDRSSAAGSAPTADGSPGESSGSAGAGDAVGASTVTRG